MQWFELNEQAKAFCFTHDQAMCEEQNTCRQKAAVIIYCHLTAKLLFFILDLDYGHQKTNQFRIFYLHIEQITNCGCQITDY